MDAMTSLLKGAYTPFFNFYDFLLLSAVMQCVVFSVFFAKYKKKPHIHSVFAAFMLTIGLGQANFFITYNLPVLTYLATHLGLWFFNLTALVFFLQGPLLYEYVRTITSGSFSPSRVQIIPIAMFLLLILFPPVSLFGGWLQDIFWRDYVLTATVGFVISAIYGVAALLHLNNYCKELENHISSLDKFNPDWLMFVCKAFVTVWVLEVLPPFFYGRAPFVIEQLIVHSKDVILLAIISYVVLSALTYGPYLKALPRTRLNKASDDTREGEGTIPEDVQQQIDQMYTLMEQANLYKKHNLTVEAFAGHLQKPAKDVSILLNTHLDKNFYEFVNTFRIEEAKKLLRSESHKNVAIQQIYEEVGFHSKSSFNTLFKKMVGTTPSRYRKGLIETPLK